MHFTLDRHGRALLAIGGIGPQSGAAPLPLGQPHLTSDSWKNLDGSWQTAANWTAGVPGANSAVLLSSTAVHAVTYDTATSTIGSLTSTTDTLAINSGKLTVSGGATLGAAVTIGAGSFVLNGSSTGSAAITVGGGTLAVGNGGSFSESGAVAVNGLGTLSVGNAGVETLSGAVTFDQATLAGPGTVATTGATSLADEGGAAALYLGAKAVWTNSGVVTDAGHIGLGVNGDTSAVTVNNTAAGVFNLTTDDAAATPYSVGLGFLATLNNAGVFNKTGGTGDSQVYFAVNNTGTIGAVTGTLELDNGGTLDGTISGTGGTLALGSGIFAVTGTGSGGLGSLAIISSNATLAVAAGASQTLSGHVGISGLGTLAVGNAGVETLSGVVTFDQATLVGPGTVATTGATSLADEGGAAALYLGAKAVWTNSGVVTDAGHIGLGVNGDTSTVTVNNTAAGVFNLTTDDAAAIPYSVGVGFLATLNNAGVFSKTGGTGDSQVYFAVNNTGTIGAATGTLELDNGGTLDGAIAGTGGTLALGSGIFAVTGTGSGGSGSLAIISSNATLAVAAGASQTLSGHVGISGLGTLAVGAGGTETLSGTVTFDQATLLGPGTVATTGATSLIDEGSANALYLSGQAVWSNAGVVTDAGHIGLGVGGDTSSATMNNTAAGVFNLTTDDAAITFYGPGQGFVATLNNAGVLNKTGGTGDSQVYFAVNNTGTIGAVTGTLELDNGGTLDGTISGTGGTLALGSGIFAVTGAGSGGSGSLAIISSNATLAVAAGASQTLSGHVGISGLGTLAVGAGGIETLSGAVSFDQAVLLGPGTVATTGAVLLVDEGGADSLYLSGQAVWSNAGIVTDAGHIGLGVGGDTTTATVNNTASGVFNLTTDDATITNYGPGAGFVATFNNAGVLNKTGGTGDSQIFAVLNSTGTIGAATGTLELDNGGTLAGSIGAGSHTSSVLLGNAGTFTAGNLTVLDNGSVAALTVGAGSTLSVTGTTTLDGKVLLSGAASLLNQSSGVLLLGNADAAVATSGSGAVFSNAGIIRDIAAGTLSLTTPLVNAGTIDAAAGLLKINNISGTGLLKIEAGATLEVGVAVPATQSYAFGGAAGATLKQDKPGSIAGTIAGFGAGDQIDLAGVTVTSAVINGATLTLTAGTKTYTYVSNASLAGLGTNIASDGTGGTTVGLYRDASASYTPQPVAFGNLHVGDTRSISLTVTNTAAADGFSEKLNASLAGLSGPFSGSGSITGLAAGASSSALTITAPASLSAGAINGSGTLVLASNGAGIDSHGTTALSSQAIVLTGGVYRLAAPSAVGGVNFGVVHVGDTVNSTLTLSNTDPNDGYSEALNASITGGPGINASGTIVGLGAGATNSSGLAVGLNTGSSGVIAGSATLGLVSNGTGIDGLGTTNLSGQTIAVTGTIDNYATASLEDPGGPAITAAGGNSYVLNLGTVGLNTGSDTIALGVLNSAPGLADLLGGTITTTGGAGFTNSGFGGFSGLGAGQDEHAQSVTLSTSSAGTFTETVTLTASGSNSSGYAGPQQTETLTITGTVISNGATYTLAAGPNTIVGASGPDLFIAAAGALNSRDSLTGSSNGANVLQLSGAGFFDVGAPKVFANIQTIQALEGQAAKGAAADTRQTVFLRDGTAESVVVASGTAAAGNTNAESITIYGASNTDTITLGAGADVVYLGGNGETAIGGGGADTFYADATAIGATINGGTGKSTLHLTGGGTFTLGGNITNVASLTLDAASAAYKVTANSLAALAIKGSGAADTITLGAATQTVNANGGAVHINATAAFATAAITGATGAVLEITSAGTLTLNNADSALLVQLDAAGKLTLNKAAFISAVGSTGNDTLVAAGTLQTLTGGLGADSLFGSATFGDTFTDVSAGLNGDKITNFGGNDVIDVTDLVFGSLTDSYTPHGSSGTLNLGDGTHSLAITLAGSYTAANFGFASDGHSGTAITFHT